MDNIPYEELKKKYNDLLKSYIEIKYRCNNLQTKIHNQLENIKIIYKERKLIDLKITNYNFYFLNCQTQKNNLENITNNNVNINLIESNSISIHFDSNKTKLNKNEFIDPLSIISNNFEILNKSQISKEKEICNSNTNSKFRENIKFDNNQKLEKETIVSRISINNDSKIVNYEINKFDLSYINNEKPKFKNLQNSNFIFSFIKKNNIIQEDNLKDEKEEEFDCVIEITRMSDLIKNGWKYYSNDNFNQYFDNIKMNYLVGIFGDKYTGKTFILNKILKKNLKQKDDNLKPSLSFKIYNNDLVFLDSLGSNLPPNYFKEYLELIDEKENEYEKNKRKIENEITTKINELFIRNFVLELSHLCIYVVPYLTNSELERINSIKKNFIDKEIKINLDEKIIKKNFNDKVIIIHNIQSLKNLKDIDNYEKILIRELNLEKLIINNTEGYYYRETEIDENGNESYLLHLILGNDNFSEMKKYNEVIFKYIFEQIKSKITRKEFNLKDKLRDYFKNFALQYFDLKAKKDLNDEMSLLITRRRSINIFKENFLSIKNNFIKYNIAQNMNLRFKNITLDFISGQLKDKNINIINKYRIYSIGFELFIEFYPLGQVIITKLDPPKIVKKEKYQKIIIEGKYESNDQNNDNKNKSLLEEKDILIDNIIYYNSFSFSCFISKNNYILTDFKTKSIDKDGKLIFVFGILNEYSEEQSLGDIN